MSSTSALKTRAPAPAAAAAVAPASTESIRSETAMAFGTIAILAMMLFPLPAILIDILLCLSMTLALIVFLFALHIERPLEFSAFPSLLLLVTLFRLALNVGSTRLILLRGSEGSGSAGHVIQAFGQFVVGGNLVVGVVIFLILIVINFVVITKGAGRIAEVTARFTLDAMPGKQMAIDADLAAGLITDKEARQRRRAVEQEADFFGSMDGASKFVRGDAVAGLIITAVNIFGGLLIGALQQGMPIGRAAAVYSQLSIGEGLVTQVPALLTSIAAGLVTTRASAGGTLGQTIGGQLFGSRSALTTTVGVLGALALVPGLPHFVLLGIAGLLFLAVRRMDGKQATKVEPTHVAPLDERQEIDASLPIDLLEIEVGYELVPLVDAERDGSFLTRIAGVRKQVALDLGVVVPPIHMHDNLQLRSTEYRILLSGNEIGRGELRLGRLLAMTPGGGAVNLGGESVVEPAFGLPARWIMPADKERAELLGCTVVDPASVAATHLGELLLSHGQEILGRREVQHLLEVHGREHSKLIEELIPNLLSLSQVIRVLKGLLRERVSIRDLRTILEALADHAQETKDVDALIEAVRQRLGRQITAKHRGRSNKLHSIMLAPSVETTFRRMQNPASAQGLDPGDVASLTHAFEVATRSISNVEELPVILTAADIRRSVMTFAARQVPGISVMSYRELDPRVSVQTVAMVGAEPQALQAGGA